MLDGSHIAKLLTRGQFQTGTWGSASGKRPDQCSQHRQNTRTDARHALQVDTPWRKAVTKLEEEEEYMSLNKLDRLEVFQEYIL